jgi:hypothetical protein
MRRFVKRCFACPSTGSGSSAGWYFFISSVVRFFRSASEKNEQQKEGKVPRVNKGLTSK